MPKYLFWKKIKTTIADYFSAIPATVSIKNYRYFLVAHVAYHFAAGLHLFWLFLFLITGIIPLFIFNIFSVTLFISLIIVNRRGLHMLTTVLGMIEVVAHQIFACYLLGYETGFALYIIVVSIYPFIMPAWKSWIKLALFLMTLLGFLFIEFFIASTPVFQIGDALLTFLIISNIFFSFFCLSIWGTYFSLAVDKTEAQLEKQKEVIATQKVIVEEKNTEIIDSINYAQRIQVAMLPPEKYVSELLNENFILYKPRDIVSGDFYWIKQVNMSIILVAADCTGHGVPGALLSMLGMSYLDEIVQRREITQSNQVLNELRNHIKHSLRQHGQMDTSRDGIDMALCVFDLKNRKMQYSGANNPLYLIKDVQGNPELNEIKADRMPLGFYPGKDKSFTNHDVQLELGDTFYMFSDGFIDQKGGKDNKKFMSNRFKKLLSEIHDEPMYAQKRILDKKLSEWMDGYPQTDDILVIGIRI